MYLTKKQLRKVRASTGTYIAIGVISVLLFLLLGAHGEDIGLLICGVVMLLFSPVVYKFGRYSEGVAKWLSLGNKLILRQLQPTEFLRLYEEARHNPDNAIAEPHFDVLQMLLVAYTALGKTDEAFDVLKQMATVVHDKKRLLLKALQASLLYTNGQIQEAERLYTELLSTKLDMVTLATMEPLQQADRAMALGDFATAEGYFQRGLTRTFPKLNPLAAVEIRFHLATICRQTGRRDEAEAHLNYCLAYGGKTVYREKARALREY